MGTGTEKRTGEVLKLRGKDIPGETTDDAKAQREEQGH